MEGISVVGEGSVATKGRSLDGEGRFSTDDQPPRSQGWLWGLATSYLGGWFVLLVVLVVIAEIGLRLPVVTGVLPDPVPRLWHGLLVQDKLDYLATMVEAEGVDVLFIGNSTTQAGVNPRVFDQARTREGLTHNLSETVYSSRAGSFNASIEGLPPFGVEMFLPIFLKRAQPEVIIYGLSAQDLNSNSPWAMDVTERVNHSPLALAESEKGLRGWFLARLLKVSRLYLYRPILLQLIVRGGVHESHLEEVYFDDRGHDAITDRKLSDIPVGERWYMANRAGVLNYSVEGVQRNGLVAVIEQSKALGIELILVNMPLADDYYGNFDRPEDYTLYRNGLAAIADEYDVPLWDMEGMGGSGLDERAFGDDDFADFNHLNQAGAVRLSEILGERFNRLRDN